MKKQLFLLPVLALFMSGCSLMPASQPTPVDTESVLTGPVVVDDFTGAFTAFLAQMNARSTAIDISPTFGLYGIYNPGAMSRVQHFANFGDFLAEYQTTSFGSARNGTGDVFTCDSYDANIPDSQQKCDCSIDTQPPLTHKCQIGTITGGNTLISEALTRDLSEVGSIPLTTGAMAQIAQAQTAESNITHRVYIEDRSIVLYFIPNGTGYQLLMMDLIDCCSA